MGNKKKFKMFKVILTVVISLSGLCMMEAQVKLMSYNIRYANETDGENSWSLRKDFLTNQIKFHQPDILGVQEAVHLQIEHLSENIPRYSYIGAGRDDGKTEGEFSAIFYDREAYEVLESNTFWLSPTPDQPSMGWDAAYKRVCTYALFKSIKTEKVFWVFNTHFDHVGEQVRRESVSLIMKRISKLNKQDHPIVLMGDLNMEPSHESIKLLTQNMKDSRDIARLVFGPEGTFNAYEFNKPVTRRIDYIFVGNNNVEVLKYAVLSDSKDLKYPSDHLPVWVELKLP